MAGNWLLRLLAISCLLRLHGSAGEFSNIQIEEDGGYTGVLVAISRTMPYYNCDSFIGNVKTLFSKASDILHVATDKKTFFKNVKILIPDSWKCLNWNIEPAAWEESFENADVQIDFSDDEPHTIQPLSCGKPGLYIRWSMKYQKYVVDVQAKLLVREWARLRYGIFEEHGSDGDSIFPRFYYDDSGNLQLTACTNEKPNVVYVNQRSNGYCFYDEHGVPEPDCGFTPTKSGNENIISSLASMPDLPKVKYFCNGSDTHPHNSRAPNKHNFYCDGSSTWDVISRHKDIKQRTSSASKIATYFRFIQRQNESQYPFSDHYEHDHILDSFVSSRSFHITSNTSVTISFRYDARSSIRNIIISKEPDGDNTYLSPFKVFSHVPYILMEHQDKKEISFFYPSPEIGSYRYTILHSLNSILNSVTVAVYDKTCNIQTVGMESCTALSKSQHRIDSYVTYGTITLNATVNFQYTNRSTIRNIILKDSDHSVYIYLSPNNTISGNVKYEVKENEETNEISFLFEDPKIKQYEYFILHRLMPTQPEHTVRVSVTRTYDKRMSCWIHQANNPERFIIFAHMPHSLVEDDTKLLTAKIYGPSPNFEFHHQLLLQDKGMDPDITSGDGVYSRYVTSVEEEGQYVVFANKFTGDATGQVCSQASEEENNTKFSKIKGFLLMHSCNSALCDDPDQYNPKTTCSTPLPIQDGIFSSTTSMAYCGKFEVTKNFMNSLPYPPSRITDLRITEQNKTSVILSWTAPGSSLDNGTVSSYELGSSYSWPKDPNKIPSENTFKLATSVIAGKLVTYPHSGDFKRTMYIAIRAESQKMKGTFSNVVQVHGYENHCDP